MDTRIICLLCTHSLRYNFKHLLSSYFLSCFLPLWYWGVLNQTLELWFCKWFCQWNILNLTRCRVYSSSAERFLSDAQLKLWRCWIQPWCLRSFEISQDEKQHELAWSWYSGLLFTPDWTGTRVRTLIGKEKFQAKTLQWDAVFRKVNMFFRTAKIDCCSWVSLWST